MKHVTCNGGSELILEPGYWRPSIYSDDIQYCYNREENCLGGNKAGDLSCKEGHIGALCEACDLSISFIYIIRNL